ncbi:MAG: outer membrane beta-barrel protein [Bacteriovoracaceae bacterium]
MSVQPLSAKEKAAKDKTNKPQTKKANPFSRKPLPARTISGIKTHSVGVGVGQTFLNGDFEDNGEDKITGELYYNFKASHSFDFLANFHHSSHDFRTTETTITGLAFAIKGKAYQFDNFSPYAFAGVGFYLPKIKRFLDGTLTSSKEKLTFGINLGGGAELTLTKKVSVGLIVHYHNPFDVKQDIGPEVEGSYSKLLLTSFYNF